MDRANPFIPVIYAATAVLLVALAVAMAFL
jgi:hypothetical protein